MPDPIYILGHKNPDADAICSAIAYEAYKHAIGQTEYVAARCGNSNARIDAILEKLGLPLPLFIGDVTPRISDIMHTEVLKVSNESTCAEALELIDTHDVRALPVVDKQNHVEGFVSIFQLGEFFVNLANQRRCVGSYQRSVDHSHSNAEVLTAFAQISWRSSLSESAPWIFVPLARITGTGFSISAQYHCSGGSAG